MKRITISCATCIEAKAKVRLVCDVVFLLPKGWTWRLFDWVEVTDGGRTQTSGADESPVCERCSNIMDKVAPRRTV